MNKLLIIIISIALGMFGQGVFQYLDYSYGFEYGLTAYGLIVASLTLSIIRHKNEGRYTRMLIYVSSFCIIVFALLTEVKIANHLVYFSLLCLTIVIASILLGHILRSQQSDNWLILIFPAVICGLYASYYLVLLSDSLFSALLLSAALVVLSANLLGNNRLKNLIISTAVITVLLLLNNMLVMSQIPAWTDAYATKPVGKYISHDKIKSSGITNWTHYGRLDSLVEQDEKQLIRRYWRLINANSALPEHSAGKMNLDRLEIIFPLLAFPLKVVEPDKMLVVAEHDVFSKALDSSDIKVKDHLVLSTIGSKDASTCCPSVAQVIKKYDEAGTKYDLIHVSALAEVNHSSLRGVSQAQAFLNKDVLSWFMGQLNDEGVLAVVVRDEVLFNQLLVNSWDMLSPDRESRVLSLSDRLSIYKLGKYAGNRGVYDYLILLSNSGMSPQVSSRIAKKLKQLPIESVIYDNTSSQKPYNIISARNTDLATSVLHLRRNLSNALGVNVILEGSDLWRPSLYNITKNSHPFLIGIFVLILLVTIYGVLLTNNQLRSIVIDEHNQSPSPSILLLHSMLCITAIVFIAMLFVMFTVSSLGMGNIMAINSMALLLGGYILGSYYERIQVSAAGRVLLPVSVVSVILLAVYFGWSYLATMEITRLFSDQSYWLMCFLLLASAAAAGYLHRYGLSKIKTIYPALSPWSVILSGMGALHGVLLSSWFLIDGDLLQLLSYGVALLSSALIVHLWMSRPVNT